MSRLAAAKLLAEIVKIGAETFGIFEDKAMARKNAERDAKIADLERQLAALKKG